ncbi:MAG: orotate phosphoribosyltransferase [Elusimicrobiota bacterium]|jgi:orotate phosphoribosyltransferase|nr:orotate phosphoribosyltransferase [Elusimicrobiota bacterium]
MEQEEVLKLFRKNKALLSGHFLLSSGLHSATYFQSALLLQDPKTAEKLCYELAEKIRAANIEVDTIVSPAIGGIIVGYELARHLNARAIFTERIDGKVILRRGFEVYDNAKILIVEDVITTGISTREVVDCLRPYHAKITGVACLVNREYEANSALILEMIKQRHVDIKFFYLLALTVNVYSKEKCPMCKAGKPLTKPGSRVQTIERTF